MFNICTNVSIILVNKYVFNVYKFNYATLVTFLHFVFTSYVSRGGAAVGCCPDFEKHVKGTRWLGLE